MTTGLLVNISIYASDMSSTELYADLMQNKQRIIKQLSKQAECVRLANDEQQLRAYQGRLTQMGMNKINQQKTARNDKKLKTDNPKQTEFF